MRCGGKSSTVVSCLISVGLRVESCDRMFSTSWLESWLPVLFVSLIFLCLIFSKCYKDIG